MKVLIVDDTRITRSCYRTLLERLPDVKDIAEASPGKEVAEQCRALAPDIIVIDIDIAEDSGSTLTKQTLSHGKNASLVAISCRSEPQLVEAVLRAGASGYVLKKHGFTELKQAVWAASVGEIYLSEELLDDRETDSGSEEDEPLLADGTPLTRRQQEVLSYVARGFSSRNIAKTLGLSLKTVETHRLHINNKLKLHSVAALTKYAIREGLTDLNE